MQPSKQLTQVLLKKKSIKDFLPSQILAPGEYKVIDPGRLVRIGNRQFQYVRGLWNGTLSGAFMSKHGVRITQFKDNGEIDYIHFKTNSEYENFQ